MPCAQMPLTEDKPTNNSVHPQLVTSLTGFQSHFYYTGLIPHPTRKGAFWGTQPSEVRNSQPEYQACSSGRWHASARALDKCWQTRSFILSFHFCLSLFHFSLLFSSFSLFSPFMLSLFSLSIYIYMLGS